ncbi:unnamed protein product [Ostreobium quekettii]|uniref:Ankyrin repeat n=1 Tax=Ostreobium quekettii TaxID=121088 RepID=A0A8S1ING9_9CHLO|nr:unnamed protein product [Ostreobium quekettii]
MRKYISEFREHQARQPSGWANSEGWQVVPPVGVATFDSRGPGIVYVTIVQFESGAGGPQLLARGVAKSRACTLVVAEGQVWDAQDRWCAGDEDWLVKMSATWLADGATRAKALAAIKAVRHPQTQAQLLSRVAGQLQSLTMHENMHIRCSASEALANLQESDLQNDVAVQKKEFKRGDWESSGMQTDQPKKHRLRPTEGAGHMVQKKHSGGKDPAAPMDGAKRQPRDLRELPVSPQKAARDPKDQRAGGEGPKKQDKMLKELAKQVVAERRRGDEMRSQALELKKQNREMKDAIIQIRAQVSRDELKAQVESLRRHNKKLKEASAKSLEEHHRFEGLAVEVGRLRERNRRLEEDVAALEAGRWEGGAEGSGGRSPTGGSVGRGQQSGARDLSAELDRVKAENRELREANLRLLEEPPTYRNALVQGTQGARAGWGMLEEAVVGFHLCEQSALEMECFERYFEDVLSRREPTQEQKAAMLDAAAQGRGSSLRLLLGMGLDPNFVDEEGDTPLHKAARYGKENALAVLLDAGVLCDVQNHIEYTAMHWAACFGRLGVARLLLGHGANAKIFAKGGGPLQMPRGTPARIASKHGYDEVLDLLKEVVEVEDHEESEDEGVEDHVDEKIDDNFVETFNGKNGENFGEKMDENIDGSFGEKFSENSDKELDEKSDEEEDDEEEDDEDDYFEWDHPCLELSGSLSGASGQGAPS